MVKAKNSNDVQIVITQDNQPGRDWLGYFGVDVQGFSSLCNEIFAANQLVDNAFIQKVNDALSKIEKDFPEDINKLKSILEEYLTINKV